MDWTAIFLSLKLAACTTGILTVVGLPLAWWLASTAWRWRFFLEALVALPLVLPPTVLGFYVLLAISPRSALGAWAEGLLGWRLPFSFTGLLIGSVLYSLPFAVQPFMSAFAGVDRRYIEASASLGEGRWGTFYRVVLPLAWPGVLSGLILCFAHTMGEFGVVLMIGGNLPGVTRTISVSIYDDVQALRYASAHQSALAMVGFAFLVLSVTYALQRPRLWNRRS